MRDDMDRRDFLRLAGIGGVVFASGLRGVGAAEVGGTAKDFVFVQMSDTHWGFNGPAVNPDAGVTLQKAVDAVNSLEQQPDFIVFTGDLTHTTDDPKERRRRMAQFREIVGKLRARQVRFMPGEHDASLDSGEAFREFFGDTHYVFDHKGIHFIALDNVSDPTGSLGEAQIQWLKADLAKLAKDTPIAVLTHRPLFDLYPEWDWATRDGDAAIQALLPRPHVTVFYGHIHQESHHMTGHIAHHSAKSLIFPLPAPGSAPKKAPIPWDADHPYAGLGFRSVARRRNASEYGISEWPVVKAAAARG
jgi:hypothetical protein